VRKAVAAFASQEIIPLCSPTPRAEEMHRIATKPKVPELTQVHCYCVIIILSRLAGLADWHWVE